MIIKFYNCKDDPRTLNKTFSTVATYDDAKPFETMNITDPVLIMSYRSDIAGANMFELPELGRIYFVTGVSLQTGGRCVVTGHVDVLASYASEINKLSVNVDKSQSEVESYIPDDACGFTNSASTTVYRSTSDFSQGDGKFLAGFASDYSGTGTYVLGLIGRSRPS